MKKRNIQIDKWIDHVEKIKIKNIIVFYYLWFKYHERIYFKSVYYHFSIYVHYGKFFFRKHKHNIYKSFHVTITSTSDCFCFFLIK